jgi:hypothetical protein
MLGHFLDTFFFMAGGGLMIPYNIGGAITLDLSRVEALIHYHALSKKIRQGENS